MLSSLPLHTSVSLDSINIAFIHCGHTFELSHWVIPALPSILPDISKKRKLTVSDLT